MLHTHIAVEYFSEFPRIYLRHGRSRPATLFLIDTSAQTSCLPRHLLGCLGIEDALEPSDVEFEDDTISLPVFSASKNLLADWFTTSCLTLTCACSGWTSS